MILKMKKRMKEKNYRTYANHMTLKLKKMMKEKDYRINANQ